MTARLSSTRPNRRGGLVCGMVCCLILCATGWAQSGAARSTQTAPDAPSSAKQQKSDSQSRTEPAAGSKGSNDRLFWTLPNFLTVENAKRIPPLTTKEKFKIVMRSTFDPVEYPYAAFLAGISQATDSEPGYGQGAAGYGKRFGASFADITVENFITGAILPSVLRQDPRYFQLGRGSFAHRSLYAASRIFVIRTDAGNNSFNASEVFGSAISAGVGNFYRPSVDRTVSDTISRWGTQIGWDTVAIAVKEFWPDVRRKMQNRRERKNAQPQPANSYQP